MFDILANPYAPCAVLLLVAGLAIGFRWGASSEANRIADDIEMLKRFRIGGDLFEGEFVGNYDDAEDDDDTSGGKRIRTVDDLLTKEQRDAHQN